jgi:HAD superfamily hydrolase (TIGR01509 family)
LKVSAVLFDLDGTLTKFNLNYGSATSEIKDELKKLGFTEFNQQQIYSLNRILSQIQDKISADAFTKFLEKVHRIMEKYEIVSAEKTELLPHTLETLEYLKDNDLKIGVVTNNGKAASRITCHRFDILRMLDIIVTREDATRWKPDGATLREALSRLNVSNEEAIFVGDSTIDVLAAHDSNVISVAIPTGPTTLKKLLKAEPDYLVSSLKEFPNLLKMISFQEERKDN